MELKTVWEEVYYIETCIQLWKGTCAEKQRDSATQEQWLPICSMSSGCNTHV